MSDEADPSPMSPSPGGSWHPPSLEQMQDLLPQYEFISLIGQGGMGAVYKATQISLDRPVAVKVLPPGADDGELGFTERFRIEARMMAKMNHPGIVSVHDFGIAGGHLLFIVMEFVDGTDVAKMIQAQGRLEPGHALAITAHVCDALRYAHGRQVVHGDIKPANVLIGMGGQVKVADFGLARFNEAGQTTGGTGSGVTLGTPDYAAPEITIEGATVDGRADLYAVGVMLYNMLTGEVPRGVFQLPGAKTGCDARLDGIVCRAMEQDPERRYQTALEIRHDLDRIIAVPVAREEPPVSRQKPAAVQGRMAPPPSQTSWVWTLAVIAALAGMGYVVWKDHKETPKVAVVAPELPKEAGSPPRPEAGDAPPRPEANGPRPGTPRPAPDGRRPSPMAPPPPTGGNKPPQPRVETEATRHLAELDSKFQAALDRDVTKMRASAIASLDAKYLAALDRALASASKSVILTEARALQAEKLRVEAHELLPDHDPADLPASVRTLLDTYRTEIAKIQSTLQPVAVSLHDKYLAVLAAYFDELTRADKVEDARRVEEKQKQVAASRVLALAAGASHDIEYVTEAAIKEKGGTADGIILKNGDKFETRESFVPPVEITAVAKTEDTNLRLAYAADQLIFNWEVRNSSLRLDGGPAAGQHKEGAGKIPKKTFVTIRWLVTPLSQTVFVDGEKRFEHFGDYSRLDRQVSVFTMNSTVTLKSLKVKPMSLPAPQKLAEVEVSGTSLTPLRPGAKLYGDNREHVWTDIPPLFSGHLFYQAARMQEPTLRLKVLSEGLVYMACTSRWGGGGSGGEWQNGLTTHDKLEADGWHAVDAAREMKSTESDHTWLMFSRACKTGEAFLYHTEKYLSPIIITDSLAGRLPNGLPDDGEAITQDLVLEPIEYQHRKNITIGRHDEDDPKKLHAVTVTSVPVTRVVDSSLTIEKGMWKAEGTRFIRCGISLYLDGMMEAKNSIFEACAMGKKGSWVIPWYSAKWNLENCIVTRTFIYGFKPGDIGLQARNCTFYGVTLAKIQYRANAAEEVKKDWLVIKNCRFVECQVPESVLIATQDCVFEHCIFGEPEPNIPVKTPMTVRIYTTEPDAKPVVGSNCTLEVLDASKVPSPAGTALRHRRRENVVDFDGMPGR
ncbi:MAG: serine/threonine protein kinase [Verrucomicrobiaceae bacterium]|nr:serine/threonine protein kinase [Verrucomicrobiaceae bacterium]